MKNSIILFVIFCSLIGVIKAQVSFVNNGQQLNGLAGRGIALADLNSDGNLDAFVVNEDGPDGNGYKLYFGDGQGQFTDSTILINPISSAARPAIGDINNDSKPEVITGWTVWMNDGSGNLTAETKRFPPANNMSITHIELADLNKDGILDAFCSVNGNQGDNLRVYLNDGNGNFIDSGQRLCQGQGVHYPVKLGDLNGDGNIDAVSTGWKNNSSDPCPNRILINDGNGNFTETGQILNEGTRHSHGLALADVDKDSDIDIILGMQASPYARIYLNDGQSNFTADQTLGANSVEKVETGDFNNDGNVDIFFACNGANEVWLNDGEGHFSDSGVRLGSEWSWNAALGDLNNDGRLDIFAVNFAADFSSGNFAAKGRLAEVWLNTSTTSATDKSTGMVNPENFRLFQNYPYPFNPTTVIGYQLAEYSSVQLKIYDTLGQKIKTLVDSFQHAGEHSIVWDATNDFSSPVSSGIYFYCLQTDKMILQKKMVLAR
jgi:hypothetical protein